MKPTLTNVIERLQQQIRELEATAQFGLNPILAAQSMQNRASDLRYICQIVEAIRDDKPYPERWPMYKSGGAR